MRGPVWLIRPAFLVRAASLLVPARRREEWMREWLTELHYAREHAGEARLMAFASGAFHDAVWQHRDFWTLDRISQRAQSALFCMASIAAVVVLIVLASGFLPMNSRRPDAAALSRRRRHRDGGPIRHHGDACGCLRPGGRAVARE